MELISETLIIIREYRTISALNMPNLVHWEAWDSEGVTGK